MRTRSLLLAAVCGVTILVLAVGRGPEPAVAARRCPADVAAADRVLGVGAVHRGRVVGTAAAIDRRVASGRAARQVTTSGERTAYVEDRQGKDAIVLATPSGTHVLPQPGEAYHPTWSRRGAVAW